MGGAVLRLVFLLSTPFPLLRRHHHKLLFLSSYSLSHRLSSSPSSSSTFSSSPLTLKINAYQHQFHSQSHTTSSPWPEWSRFLSHISSVGYLPSFPDDVFAPTVGDLSQSYLRDATACLAFARDRPNLLRLLPVRDIAAVVEHGSPFLFRDPEDCVRKMKSFVSNSDANVMDTDRANTVDLMKFMLSYASNPFGSSERNDLCNRGLVESSVRNLFGELFKLSYNTPGPNSSDSAQSQMEAKVRKVMALKPLLLRRIFRSLPMTPTSPFIHVPPLPSLNVSDIMSLSKENALRNPLSSSSRNFCSHSSNLLDESQGPMTIDYHSLLQEGEFQRLADSTIHSLQEKLEDYGDSVEVDGFDIDYGNDVLTVKLGELGTYVLNKQTPNRQLWLSSPLSGPSRFDWDREAKAWIYRRTKANLNKILEEEQIIGDDPLEFTLPV
ncbi:hypothetical protein VNO77_16863 [Canavalia gladiata]|uniref:ferroxidase n=1 Tax=Canavalia gladiata TaxID=3824 RepID=A0AAN9LIM1_CANGL